MNGTRSAARRLWTVGVAVSLIGAWLASPATAADEAPSTLSTLPSGNDDYRTLAAYEADMAELGADHPDLVRPLTLPYETSSGRDVQGIEISRDVQADDGKPVFVTVGMHHGNEKPSGELTMEFALDVVENADDPGLSRGWTTPGSSWCPW